MKNGTRMNDRSRLEPGILVYVKRDEALYLIICFMVAIRSILLGFVAVLVGERIAI